MLGALASGSKTPYVVGCSASGVIACGSEVESGPAIGVLAVVSDELTGTPFLFHDEGDQGATAGIRLGQRLSGSRDSDDLVLVWPDAYHVRPDRLLRSLDAMLERTPVVGGAASASPNREATFQFCGNETGRSAVSGLRLGGSFRHVVGVTQGCRHLGEPLRVTRSHENLILELEGRPPFDVLRRRVPREMADELASRPHLVFVGLLPDPDLSRVRPGEYLVRNIVSADPDTGVLAVADRVEEGQYALFALREPLAARRDLAGMLERLSADRTGLRYRFGLYFNCLARGRSLYGEDGIDTELLNQALPDLPILGFFCNAEMGPVGGINQLLTYTGLLLLVGE
jgi:small ligand-binding sensory domain FIST